MGAKDKRPRQGQRSASPRIIATTGAASMAARRPGARPIDLAPLPARGSLLVALASALGLLLGGAMVGLSLLSVSGWSSAPIAGPGSSPVAANPEPSQGDPRSKGSLEAPVVITEWLDFQCPACGSYALNQEPEIQRLYVDTGKARFVDRNMAFLGPESTFAAEAAQCAADQGRYWAFRTLLFQRQRGENQGAFRPENLKRFAAELGLDQKAFNSCLDGGVYRNFVQRETREGEAQGVRATPSFQVNGRLIPGVPSVQALGRLIEEEIARRR